MMILNILIINNRTYRNNIITYDVNIISFNDVNINIWNCMNINSSINILSAIYNNYNIN